MEKPMFFRKNDAASERGMLGEIGVVRGLADQFMSAMREPLEYGLRDGMGKDAGMEWPRRLPHAIERAVGASRGWKQGAVAVKAAEAAIRALVNGVSAGLARTVSVRWRVATADRSSDHTGTAHLRIWREGASPDLVERKRWGLLSRQKLMVVSGQDGES